MYINDQLCYDTYPEDINCSDDSLEMLSLIVKPKFQRNFIITLVYIPPSADKKIAIERIKQLSLPNTSSAVRILAGDFNMEYSAKRERLGEYHLLQSLERSLTLKQIISKPTRKSSTVSSLIDLIFISASAIENISMKAVINFNISDHNIICFSYKKETLKAPRTSFRFRKKDDYNLAKLLYNFDKHDWSTLFASTDPTECWSILYSTYLTVLNKLAPYVVKTNVPSKESWIDNNAIQKLKIRDDLSNKLNYTNDPAIINEFKKARNSARQAVNIARSKFVQEGLEEQQQSP